MAKKGRKWLIVLAVVVVAVAGGIAWFFKSITSEHPDYIRAARELPAARRAAEVKFGPLDWASYRTQHGIQPADDRAAWRKLDDSVPTELTDWLKSSTPDQADYAGLYTRNKAWFLELELKVARLSLQHIYNESLEWVDYEQFSNARTIDRVSVVGLLGSASVGDADGFRSIARAVISIVEKCNREPDLMSAVVSRAVLSRLVRSIASAVVLSPYRLETAAAANEVLGLVSDRVGFYDVLAGEARTMRMVLDRYRKLSFNEIESTMETSGYESFIGEPPAVQRFVADVLSGFSDDEMPLVKRRVGPHTVDALESRVLQILCQVDDLGQKYANDPVTYIAHARLIRDKLDRLKDRSYEFAYVYADELTVQAQMKSQFGLDAARACIEVLIKYPTFSSLPTTIDDSLKPIDPYNGKRAIYKKTTNGFFFSAVGPDKTDDSASIVLDDKPGASYKRVANDDWAFVVTFPK